MSQHSRWGEFFLKCGEDSQVIKMHVAMVMLLFYFCLYFWFYCSLSYLVTILLTFLVWRLYLSLLKSCSCLCPRMTPESALWMICNARNQIWGTYLQGKDFTPCTNFQPTMCKVTLSYCHKTVSKTLYHCLFYVTFTTSFPFLYHPLPLLAN